MKTPKSVWWTWWLVAFVVAIVIVAAFALPGCRGTPVVEPRPDVLESPFGYVFSILRTVLQWVVIVGLACIIPAVRAVVFPLLSMLFRAPAVAFSGRQREAAKRAARRAGVGASVMVRGNRATYAQLQKLGQDEGWIEPHNGALKVEG
jgi:hypothetical protein